MSTIRLPAVAGQFYPEDPERLRSTVEGFLSAVPAAPEMRSKIIGCVVPHAGYMYSGATAAYTYRALSHSRVQTVFLIGPSHRDSFRGASVYAGDGFQTPLGIMPVNMEVARKMSDICVDVVMSDRGHRHEHALEVQIPFLQVVLPGANIVPVTMGDQDRDTCTSLSTCIADCARDEAAIIVASSDLSHFHAYEVATDMDAQSAAYIKSFDTGGFMEALEERHIEACGGGPVAVAMMAAKHLGATSAEILHACNSGDVSGDRTSVVGYVSALLLEESA